MSEPYQGQSRWFYEKPEVTKEDIEYVKNECKISEFLAEMSCQSYSDTKKPRLQQFNGRHWEEITKETELVRIEARDVVKRIKNNDMLFKS